MKTRRKRVQEEIAQLAVASATINATFNSLHYDVKLVIVEME